MIKVELNRGVFESLELNGSIVELTADMMMLMRTMYEELKEMNESKAELFKTSIERNVGIAFKTSKEIVEETKKNIEKAKKESEEKEDKFDKLLDKLDEVSKLLNETL